MKRRGLLLRHPPARQADDPYATRATVVSFPASAGSRFRILRPHAKGGLGQVSVALDTELNREIALKEIQDRHADEPAYRSRFTARFAYDTFDPNAKTKVFVIFPDGKMTEIDADFAKVK